MEGFFVICEMDSLGYDFKLGGSFFDAEIGGGEKRAVDCEDRGAVFEY